MIVDCLSFLMKVILLLGAILGAILVEERLDRGFANVELMAKFPHILCHHLFCRASDHQPLLCEVFTELEWVEYQLRKKRRFELI